jgi:antitoxin PrlF
MFDESSKNYYNKSMKTIVSEKGQITIPKPIRDKMGIHPGTVLEIETSEDKIIALKKEPVDVFSKWKGKAKLPDNLSVDEYIKMVRE